MAGRPLCARRAPPVTILGSLDGVAAGLRQLRRSRPLETTEFEVGPGLTVRVPTADEILRIKAYLIVQRNQVRDYLDVVALSEHVGSAHAIAVLKGIDDDSDDRSRAAGSVLTALVLALSDPQPRDIDVIKELPRYRNLDLRWQDWTDVARACQDLALHLAVP